MNARAAFLKEEAEVARWRANAAQFVRLSAEWHVAREMFCYHKGRLDALRPFSRRPAPAADPSLRAPARPGPSFVSPDASTSPPAVG